MILSSESASCRGHSSGFLQDSGLSFERVWGGSTGAVRVPCMDFAVILQTIVPVINHSIRHLERCHEIARVTDPYSPMEPQCASKHLIP